MKIILCLFLAAPLCAGDIEIGLNYSNQSYSKYTLYGMGMNYNVGNSYSFDPKTVVAVRLGYTLVNIGPTSLQGNVAYQPKKETDFKYNGQETGTKLSTEYFAIGTMFNFKMAVPFGVGLDARFEKKTINDPWLLSPGSAFVRPWIRLNAGYTFPTAVVHPFVYFEIAAPLISKHDTANFQAGIYAGFRL